MDDLESQVCTGCHNDFPLVMFDRDRSKRNGRRAMCKGCRNRRDRELRAGVAPPGRLKRGLVEVPVERKPSPEEWAWLAAMERLAANHEREALGLIYSERASRGLIEGLELPQRGRGR